VKAFIAIVVAFALLLSMTGCLYDGFYWQAEYQIKFVTPDGRPIDGVQLEVLDESGNISYGYPVTDYYEGGIPTSDADGVITFHHVQYTMEWGGMFFFGCVAGSGPQVFDLLFSENGRLIYDTKYHDFNREVKSDTPTITRKVSVYDAGSAEAAMLSDVSEPPRIVEESLEFPVVEQTVVVENH
jgi:hypothetical protein